MSSTKISNLPDNDQESVEADSLLGESADSLSPENKYINSIIVFLFLLLGTNSHHIPWKYPRYILSILLSIVLAVIYEFIKI